jgi:hypothetical protein
MIWAVLPWVFIALWLLVKYRPWVRAPFINRSNLTLAQLEAYWNDAQYIVANFGAPTGQEAHFGNPKPNPKALTTRPRALLIEPVPDIPYRELIKLTTPKYVTGDPTRMFRSGDHFVAGRRDSPFFGPPHRVQFVASTPSVLVHEFIHVLHKLL